MQLLIIYNVACFLTFALVNSGNNWRKQVTLESPAPQYVTSSTYNASDVSRRVLTIPATVNYGGSVFTTGPICTESMKIALDNIKNMPNILPNYELRIQVLDDQCSRPVLVSKFVNEMRRNDEAVGRFPISLGAFCTGHVYTGAMHHHLNFVGLTTFTLTYEILRFRNRYQSYYVTTPSPNYVMDALADFFEAMGWLKFATFSESSSFYNDMESRLIAAMEKKKGYELLGVTRFTYLSGQLPGSSDIENAVAELRSYNPRIILFHSSSSARVACWFHRYKLYGPNYALFVISPLSFSPKDPQRFDWCTEEMLSEVLESVFYFGSTNAMNLYDVNTYNSLGETGKNIEAKLKSAIEDPEASPYWWFWRSQCYDVVMTAALLLNETESALHKRNESLLDWTTDTSNFQNNGQKIKTTLQDSLYSMRFRTLSGDADFERETTTNSRGRMFIGFFQVRRQNATSNMLYPVPVAVHNPDLKPGSGHTIEFGPGKFEWRTHGGQVPPDSVKVVRIAQPSINEIAFIVFVIISSMEVIASVVISVLNMWLRSKNTPVPSIQFANFILFGNVVFEGYILAQPSSASTSYNVNCMAAYACFFVGLGCILMGMTGILELTQFNSPLTSRATISKRLSSNTNPSVRQIPRFVVKRNKSKVFVGVSVCYTTVSCALLVVWFVISPITVQVVNTDYITSESDISLAFQYYYYGCTSNNSSARMAIIGILCSFYAMIALRACLLAYTLRNVCFLFPILPSLQFVHILQKVDKAPPSIFGKAAKCITGTIGLLVGAAIVAGAIFQNDENKIHLALSFTILACVALNLGVLFLPHLIYTIKHPQQAGGIQAVGQRNNSLAEMNPSTLGRFSSTGDLQANTFRTCPV